MTRRTAALVLIAATIAALTTTSCGESRQEQVAARGRQVMPFDLEKTTHRYTPAPTGLVETVVVDHPDRDAAQIPLVRGHLRAEAARFGRGDYSDPARIHGSDMPGLAALERGAARIRVVYADLPAGGTITYTSDDPGLVDALHAWGDAQVSDHGEHAEKGD